MYYKYEMHCHDRLCSACAHSLPEELVRALKSHEGRMIINGAVA